MLDYTHAPFGEVDSEDVSIGDGRLLIGSLDRSPRLSSITIASGEVFFDIDSGGRSARVNATTFNRTEKLKITQHSIRSAERNGIQANDVLAIVDPLLESPERLAEEFLRFKLSELTYQARTGLNSEISSSEVCFYSDLYEISRVVGRADLSTALYRLTPDFAILDFENPECARRARVEACHYEAGA